MYRFDPTGLVNTTNSLVLAEDRFDTGMAGWTQLFTPSASSSKYVAPVTRIGRSGTSRIALLCPAINMGSTNFDCMALKRMANVHGDGKHLVEMMISLETKVSTFTDRPGEFQWGLDVADLNGNRRFYAIRYQVYSNSGAASVNKWQVRMGKASSDSNWVDLPFPAGVTPPNPLVLTNENKAFPVYLAFVINTSTHKIEGIRFGNYFKLGSLADVPTTALTDLGQVQAEDAPLTTFAGGLNPFFAIVPRTSAGRTQFQSNLHWHRTTFLGQ